MKKGKSTVSVIVTILIMIIVFSALIFTGIKIGFLKLDMSVLPFIKSNDKEEKQEEQVDIYSEEYNVDDYVIVTKDEESGLKLVEFKNVKSDKLDDFVKSQEDFKDKVVEKDNKKTNTIRTNVNKAILSVYSKETIKKSEDVLDESSYAANVNIKTNVPATNSQMIELYNIKEDALVKTVLNKLIENVSGVTLVDTNTQDTVKASDMNNNISKYTTIVKENIEKLTIYTRKDKLYCDVNNEELLTLLGLKLNTTNSAIKQISSISL